MVNFGQIVDNTLKLIDNYSSRGSVMAANKVADYKFKIQAICNDTIMELATTNAKLPKTMLIPHNPICNKTGDDTSQIVQHLPGEDFSISLLNAKSTFLECTGPATIVIEETLDNVIFNTLEVINIDASVTSLTELKRLISPSSALSIVRLRFTGDYIYLFRNYILYPYTFPTEDAIQQHRPWFIVDSPSDFLDLDYVEVKNDNFQYIPYNNFIKTSEGQFSFYSYDGPMELLIHYWRKPNLLTFTADDNANRALTIDLRDDAAMIISYNCAGEVLNSEEKGTGNVLIQEYMTKRMNLIPANRPNFPNTIINTSNW